jgi:predicted transcriptional regulator
MGQSMIRINDRTHQVLREMAQVEHQSMQAVLEKAVEDYRRTRFLEDVNAAYAALKNDPEAWQEIQAERAEWEAMPDGLPEEAWTDNGQVSKRNGKRLG